MLRLTGALKQAIERHGEKTYPAECCGFLLGNEVDGVKVVVATHRASNTRHDSPNNRYLIPPGAYNEAEQVATMKGLDLVGCYHSHPDVAARPSQFDRDHAVPWWSYVIVSVREARAVEILSWHFDDPDAPFESEEMTIEE